MWFKSPDRKRFQVKALDYGCDQSNTHRQELIDGFDQPALQAAHIHFMGAGGIGAELAQKAARKGLGRISISDADLVDHTNLNRQLFERKDIGKNKAVATAKHLKRISINKLTVDAFSLYFEDIVELGWLETPDILVCGVDNMRSRAFASEYAYTKGIPMISVAVDYTAEGGVVFIQSPGTACYGCLNKGLFIEKKAPCFAAASADILSIVNGFALRAIDSLLMPKMNINWNFVEAHVAGYMQTVTRHIPKSSDCPICGHNPNHKR